MSYPSSRQSRPHPRPLHQSLARVVGVVIVMVVMPSLLSACNLLDWHQANDRSWKGTYAWGFEESAFRVCESTKRWWVTSGDPEVSEQLFETHQELTNNTMYQEVFVRVRGTPLTRALLDVARKGPAPLRVVAHRPLGVAGDKAAIAVPLLAERNTVDNRSSAYLCVDFTCQAPTSDPAALRAQLLKLWAAGSSTPRD